MDIIVSSSKPTGSELPKTFCRIPLTWLVPETLSTSRAKPPGREAVSRVCKFTGLVPFHPYHHNAHGDYPASGPLRTHP